jgi:pimeloyl-ACP methyl ester carboxylesterase
LDRFKKADVRTRIIYGALAIITILFSMGNDLMAQTSTSTVAKNIVLVHGGLVDGSGWKGVYKALKKDGYTVAIVQNPTISLADDVAVTKRAIATQNGPVILVGHSYGGVVITEADNDPKVAGLVYITAFAPDKGESAASLIKNAPPGAPVPPILPPQDGYLFLDKAKFPAAFAADVSPDVGFVHGRLPSPVGCRGAQWCDHPAGVANKAKLVLGLYRRQNDPA